MLLTITFNQVVNTMTGLILLSLIILSLYYSRLANVKARTIESIISSIPFNNIEFGAPIQWKSHHTFPDMSYVAFARMYDSIVDNISFNDINLDQNKHELYSTITSEACTINQVASLILNRNGYKFRTIYGRSNRQGNSCN